MMQAVQASHYSGCGNDFLLLDNRAGEIPHLTAPVIQKLCHKKTGAGVDGLILVMPSKKGDAAMQFFNSDGHEAEMCGNGVRCLMQFMRQKLFYPRTRCLLETKLRDILLTVENEVVTVQMGKVIEHGWDIALVHNKKNYLIHHVNTGVPHIVLLVDDVAAVDVAKVGRHFRRHSRFKPDGVNVNFVSLAKESHPKESYSGITGFIRTFERGVEAETLACGTGVTAAAYVLHKHYGHTTPISLQVQSKEILTVEIEPHTTQGVAMYLKGAATWVRDTLVFIDVQTNACMLQQC